MLGHRDLPTERRRAGRRTGQRAARGEGRIPPSCALSARYQLRAAVQDLDRASRTPGTAAVRSDDLRVDVTLARPTTLELTVFLSEVSGATDGACPVPHATLNSPSVSRLRSSHDPCSRRRVRSLYYLCL